MIHRFYIILNIDYLTSCLFAFSQTLTTAIQVYVRMAEHVATVSIATRVLVLPATPDRTVTPVSTLVIFPYNSPYIGGGNVLKRNNTCIHRLTHITHHTRFLVHTA